MTKYCFNYTCNLLWFILQFKLTFVMIAPSHQPRQFCKYRLTRIFLPTILLDHVIKRNETTAWIPHSSLVLSPSHPKQWGKTKVKKKKNHVFSLLAKIVVPVTQVAISIELEQAKVFTRAYIMVKLYIN